MVIAYTITIHKSQGSALEFIVGDLSCATDKGPIAASVNWGQVYALLSRATSRGKIKLVNFEPKHLKSNHEAKKEIERMSKESGLVWKHPLTEISGYVIYLLNIRSWKAYIIVISHMRISATQPAITCSNLTIETLEQSVKYIQS